MGYLEDNLLPGEQLVYKASLHWIIYVRAALVLLVGAGLAAVEPTVGALVMGLGLVLAVPAYVRARTSEFGVTTKRVVIKVGLIRRRTVELLLRHVEAMAVDQSVVGRLLGFGSITLSGTGGVREVFHNISAPLDFRRHVHSQTA